MIKLSEWWLFRRKLVTGPNFNDILCAYDAAKDANELHAAELLGKAYVAQMPRRHRKTLTATLWETYKYKAQRIAGVTMSDYDKLKAERDSLQRYAFQAQEMAKEIAAQLAEARAILDRKNTAGMRKLARLEKALANVRLYLGEEKWAFLFGPEERSE